MFISKVLFVAVNFTLCVCTDFKCVLPMREVTTEVMCNVCSRRPSSTEFTLGFSSPSLAM